MPPSLPEGRLEPTDRRTVTDVVPIMRHLLIIVLASSSLAPAWAVDEPGGCDKFKWSIDRERAVLTSPDQSRLSSGDELTGLPEKGVTLDLRIPGEAGLPVAPERAPKEGTFAGFAVFKTAPKVGTYAISLSAAGWVDVVQNGQTLKPRAFSGATDCDGIRKTIKYEIGANPFVLQISGTKNHSISFAILPSD